MITSLITIYILTSLDCKQVRITRHNVDPDILRYMKETPTRLWEVTITEIDRMKPRLEVVELNQKGERVKQTCLPYKDKDHGKILNALVH